MVIRTVIVRIQVDCPNQPKCVSFYDKVLVTDMKPVDSVTP